MRPSKKKLTSLPFARERARRRRRAREGRSRSQSRSALRAYKCASARVRARARVEVETAIARRLLLDTRARLHQIVLGFFFLRRSTQNYTKNCLFSPIEKDRNISVCRSYTGRISLPSTPSLLRPAVRYTLVYVSPPSPPTPLPPLPSPISIWRDINCGLLSFPSQCRVGGGERGEIAVDISVEIFVVIIYIPHNDTFLF